MLSSDLLCLMKFFLSLRAAFCGSELVILYLKAMVFSNDEATLLSGVSIRRSLGNAFALWPTRSDSCLVFVHKL